MRELVDRASAEHFVQGSDLRLARFGVRLGVGKSDFYTHENLAVDLGLCYDD